MISLIKPLLNLNKILIHLTKSSIIDLGMFLEIYSNTFHVLHQLTMMIVLLIPFVIWVNNKNFIFLEGHIYIYLMEFKLSDKLSETG